MEKKIPSVFANKVDGDIGNNSKFFYSSSSVVEGNGGDDREISSLDAFDAITSLSSNDRIKFGAKGEERIRARNVSQKINDIFKSSSYVYKADVEIVLKNGKVKKRIVGKNSLYLITIENELIPISDVIDIRIVN